MKALSFLITVLFFILVSNSTYGQKVEVGNNYFFKSGLASRSSERLSIQGEVASAEEEIKNGHKIKIIEIKDDTVYFKYLIFGGDKNLSEATKQLRRTYNYDSSGNTKKFSLSKEAFKKLTADYFNRFRGFKYGAYTLPIRLRWQEGEFEFDSNVSLGSNVILGVGNRKKDYSLFDFSLGVGITKVDLNTENSLLGSSGTDFEKIEVLSPTAFTLSLGMLINLAKDVNIGFYLGWDKISSADNKAEWIYNEKPWVGIGLNVSFSNGPEASSGKNTKN